MNLQNIGAEIDFTPEIRRCKCMNKHGARAMRFINDIANLTNRSDLRPSFDLHIPGFKLSKRSLKDMFGCRAGGV
jgi:hypothetical protein